MKTVSLVIWIALMSMNIGAQIRPLEAVKSARSDRIIELRTLFSVQGDSSDYFFKNPRLPIILPGNKGLLVSDKDQLLLFDMKGNFQKNIMKMGEGPGEWARTSSMTLYEDGLCLVADVPNKVLYFGDQFKIRREFHLDKAMNLISLVNANSDGGALFCTEFDWSKASEGLKQSVESYRRFDAAGHVQESRLSFQHRIFFEKRLSNRGEEFFAMHLVDPFCHAVLPEEGRMLVTDFERYRLHLVDLRTEKIVMSLNRSFPRNAWVREPNDEKGFLPESGYFNDISTIIPGDGVFWVFTSQRDVKKGVSVDLIDGEGRYMDRFWLPLPNLPRPDRLGASLLYIDRNRIAWIHRDDDDNPMISVLEYQ